MDGSSAERAQKAREQLVTALHQTATGDRAALQHVYELTSAKLFGICLRICGDREAAEDVLQDVYVKVWRRAASFDAQRASPISWLAIIARNTAVDWRRAQPHHATTDDQTMALIPDDGPLADHILEQSETRDLLLACLDGLEADQAVAIRRTFLGGLTYSELADRLRIPLGTIKSRIRRGMQGLKECLGDA